MNLPEPPAVPAWQRPQTFYGHPLEFNAKTHRYFWQGRAVPSVTTILGRLDKPGLIWWAAEEAVKAMQRGETPEEARKAHDKIKRTAGDIGNVLHDIAVDVQAHEDAQRRIATLPEQDRPIAQACTSSLTEWFNAQRHGSVDLERKVMSREHFYAGRCDRFGVINDRLAVLDYKSGGEKIYPETWVQMAAYEVALREELGINEDVWHYAIHINKKTGKVTPYVRGPEHTAYAKMAWKQLVAFDRFMRQVPTDAQMAKMVAA